MARMRRRLGWRLLSEQRSQFFDLSECQVFDVNWHWSWFPLCVVEGWSNLLAPRSLLLRHLDFHARFVGWLLAELHPAPLLFLGRLDHGLLWQFREALVNCGL